MPDPAPTKQKQDDIKVLSGEEAAALGMQANISGQLETVPLSKLLERYQKEAAAERRFAEAHEIKKTAELSIDVRTDLKEGLAESDPTKLRRAFKNAGATDEQLETIFAPPAGPQTLADTQRGGTGTSREVQTDDAYRQLEGDTDEDERFNELMGTIEELQGTVKKLTEKEEKRAKKKEEAKITGAVDKALDSDPELSKIMGELDEESAKDLRQFAYGKVGQAMKTVPWGPRAIEEGLKVVKARIVAFKGKSTSDTEGGSPDTTGIGPSGHTVSQLHQIPQGKKLMPHEEGYEASMLKRGLEKLKRGRKSD
jgi:hypothetical protein